MAYYSQLRPTVYHEFRNCHVGDNLVKGNQIIGTTPIVIRGKRLKLCKVCAQLHEDKKGIPGIPIPPEPGKTLVETYYSTESPEIFHICQNCFLGQNIDEENLVANQPPLDLGRKKARLCKTCVKLCIGGECITGTHIPTQ